MVSRLQILLLWCAVALTWAQVSFSDVMDNGIKEELEQTDGPLLDDEMDNQENILTQVFRPSSVFVTGLIRSPNFTHSPYLSKAKCDS